MAEAVATPSSKGEAERTVPMGREEPLPVRPLPEPINWLHILGPGMVLTALGVGVAHRLESLVHWLERALGTQFLDARVYFMSDLPAYVQWGDVARVCGVAFALCALATLYPAWRAARTAPAEALRRD